MEISSKAVLLALSLTGAIYTNAQQIVKQESTTEETSTEKKLPWSDKLFLYRYDTHHNTDYAYDNIGVGVFYDQFKEDPETGDWYVEFTSQSDVYTYFLYTSEDDVLEMYTESGSNEYGSYNVGDYKNMKTVYNPTYLAIPSTTPPGKEETHSSAYGYTIENCFSKALPTVNGGLSTKYYNWTSSTKFVRGVKYRVNLHLNDARDNADMTIKRIDWDNYVEGSTSKKYIYFDNSVTKWDNVYAAAYVFSEKTDSDKNVLTAESNYYTNVFTFTKLGDTDIYFSDFSNYNVEFDNIFFIDTTSINPFSSANQNYENRSLQFGFFNEALYSKDKIYNYATTYVPKPLAVQNQTTPSLCTFKSAVARQNLYYKVEDFTASSQSRAQAQASTTSNVADVEGWTLGGYEQFDFDLSTIGSDKMICVKAVSGVEDGAESESIALAYVNNTLTGIDDIAFNAENAVPEYFNLQGVKIAEPVKGQVVIEKIGNKVRKINW
jgi:hypothetical protein